DSASPASARRTSTSRDTDSRCRSSAGRRRPRPQMAQPLLREHHGVVVHLAQILGRPLLDRAPGAAVAEIRPHLAAKVRAGGVGGQIAAAVRRADLDPRIPVERAVENQMRERNRGLERVANYVREIAVAAETVAELR